MAKNNTQTYKESFSDDPAKYIAKIVGAITIGLLLVVLAMGSFYTVGAGERGVVLTWGSASTTASEPGLHFKIPIAQKVAKMGVQTNKYVATASAASSDLQVVTSQIAVNYHLNPEAVPIVYRDLGLGYSDTIINPAVQESVKAATAKYTAEELVTHRNEVKTMIQESLTQRLVGRNVVVEDVNIVDFDFSEEFNRAIELKVTAEQKKLQAQNDLERIKVEAMQVEAAAIGQKNAKIASAEGDAKAIELVQNQLSRDPTYISYLATQKWNGVLPSVTGAGAVPFVDVTPKAVQQ